MQNIINGIRRYYPVSDASLALLFSKMKKAELPKKHLLIRGGVIDRHVYFIEKGSAVHSHLCRVLPLCDRNT